MEKFGVEQVIRTGKIALKRGENILQMGGWGDSLISRDAKSVDSITGEMEATNRYLNTNFDN